VLDWTDAGKGWAVPRAMHESHRSLFTIGHSNHALSDFLALLQQHRVEVVADVRSHPASRFATHFDRAELRAPLNAAGVDYLYLGTELGGRPDEPEFYDPAGHVLYGRVAESSRFLQGIARLERGIEAYRVAILCSEEDPTHCHRRLLVGRVLHRRGVPTEHIRGDGSVESEELLLQKEELANAQLSLFDQPQEAAWRSTRSVLRRNQPSTSSNP
jgi:uncharacterized protein (DUF488 family)